MTDSLNINQNPNDNGSKICRVCGIESESGQKLFDPKSEVQEIAVQICSFISIKLENIQIYPNWICPGCHLQFEATDEFFELIKNGQIKLGEAYGYPPKVVKKRGRKRKYTYVVEPFNISDNPQNSLSTSKRISKTPRRLKDTMQGDELESLYTEIGITKRRLRQSKTKAIAHIEDQNGVTIGEMISTSTETSFKNKTRYKCDFCDEMFVKELAFYSHLSNHTNILYECSQCRAVFQAKAMFNQHVRETNHVGLGIIETPPQDTNLSQDQTPLTTITDQKPLIQTKFVCINCSKTFDTNLAMQRHQKTHYELRPYQCEICMVKFKRKTILDAHKATHKNEHPFKCHKCSRRFTLKHTMQNHIKWVHEGIKPYSCKICQKSFSHKSNLTEHKRIHTGDRPFVCLKCGSAFKTSSQCRLHQKSHVNEISDDTDPNAVRKSFECSTCGKLFSLGSSLSKHLRTHTGEKPYSCHLCPRKFADASNFRKHKKNHPQNKKPKAIKVSLPILNAYEEESSNAQLDAKASTAVETTSSEHDQIIPAANSFTILENTVLPNVDSSLIGIIAGDEDRNAIQWNSDLMITDIPNDEGLLVQQQQQEEMLLNQLVCISYQDPTNPVGSKTTYYVVNQGN